MISKISSEQVLLMEKSREAEEKSGKKLSQMQADLTRLSTYLQAAEERIKKLEGDSKSHSASLNKLIEITNQLKQDKAE